MSRDYLPDDLDRLQLASALLTQGCAFLSWGQLWLEMMQRSEVGQLYHTWLEQWLGKTEFTHDSLPSWTLLDRSLRSAGQELQQRLQTHPCTSLHELFGLWVECGERAHQTLLRDPVFCQTSAQALNAWLEAYQQRA